LKPSFSNSSFFILIKPPQNQTSLSSKTSQTLYLPKWFITTVTINLENNQSISKMKSHRIMAWTVLALFIAKEQSQNYCLFSSSSLFSLVAMFLHLFSLDHLSLYLFCVSISYLNLVFLLLICCFYFLCLSSTILPCVDFLFLFFFRFLWT